MRILLRAACLALTVALGLGGCATDLPGPPRPTSETPQATSTPGPTPQPTAKATVQTDVGDIPTYWEPKVTTGPKGPTISQFETLVKRSNLSATLNGAPAGHQVALRAGIYTFTDFDAGTGGTWNGVAAWITGLRGSGVGRTVLQMKAHTSTKKAMIPRAFPATNQLSLVRLTGDDLTVSGFTLRGTNQGHLYNGLRIDHADRLDVHDVKVQGVPGSSSSPPGETFGLNDYRTNGSVYTRVEVDGAGVGGAGFGANVSKNITIRDSYFHDNRYSMGATFWEVQGITLIDTIATDNGRVGINLERVSGAVRMVRPVLLGNHQGPIRIASDRGSAKVTIVDPVFSGSHFTVVLPRTYYDRPNLQRRSDVHLIVHGQDRTEQLVRFIGD
ncbi:right-handed parallel beta-helix repeat-containing protein [uncultured Amnibacterium sp.]|uniref:right-handed parallel beta-helix repeat-containing protein n=1 Tax=uncultured Amnibacterium sp. TaxID=1631851 RepID=UPI0035CA0913